AGIRESRGFLWRDPIYPVEHVYDVLLFGCDPFGHGEYRCASHMETHREEGVEALETKVARIYVRRRVGPGMAYVLRRIRVWEGRGDIALLSSGFRVGLERLFFRPSLAPFGLDSISIHDSI